MFFYFNVIIANKKIDTPLTERNGNSVGRGGVWIQKEAISEGLGGGGVLSYREFFPRAPNAIARAPSKIGKSAAALLWSSKLSVILLWKVF